MPIVVSSGFSEENIEVGDIIWYINDNIDNPDPHPHVIVAIEDDWLYTVCGTSQQATIERKANNLCQGNYSLFPAIRPSRHNTLSKTTFFDCISYFDIHISKLKDKFENGEVVKNGGVISYDEYEQIRVALMSSPTIDICDLLIHPSDNLGQ